MTKTSTVLEITASSKLVLGKAYFKGLVSCYLLPNKHKTNTGTFKVNSKSNLRTIASRKFVNI